MKNWLTKTFGIKFKEKEIQFTPVIFEQPLEQKEELTPRQSQTAIVSGYHTLQNSIQCTAESLEKIADQVTK